MTERLSAEAQRVQDVIAAAGLELEVRELPASTRTAAEAADAIGCEVSQIAKSLVFHRRESDAPLLVIASGSNRVNREAVSALVGERIALAAAEFVRARTGFTIGGVPPVGHASSMEVFIDEDLRRHDEIWAAAGTSHAVFRLTPADLEALTGGRVVRVT